MKRLGISPAGIGDWLIANEFVVPKYQRPYAWKREHVLNMLTDISSAVKRMKAGKGETYFMGAVVVVNRAGQKALEVVDGQQRLATISIILAAIRDYHLSASQAKAATQYDQYLRLFHVPTSKYRPRLRLNAADNPCFVEAILEEPEKRKRMKWTLASHKRMLDAYALASEHVASIAKINTPRDTIDILYEMSEFIRSHVNVIHVGVDDEADAFTIFETLNDRHLSLTVADLLKNFLFGASGDDLVEETKTHWDTMTGALQVKRGKKDRTVDFIRQVWGSMHGLVREKELFRDIKTKILDSESAIELAHALAHQAPLYAAILDPTNDVWDGYGDRALNALMTFNSLRVERIRPLLLAILDRFSVKDVGKSLDYLRSAAVRIVSTTGINGTIEEKIYSLAVKIHRGEITKFSRLAKAIDFVPNDKIFEANFATMRVSKAALARFYLAAIEDYAKNDPEHSTSRNTLKVDLEHIIPDAASERAKHWPELSGELGEALKYRLGNLTLMPKRKNSALNGRGFSEKLSIYSACESIYITKTIASDYSTWGEKEVNLRQEWLAKAAVNVWPLKVSG